MRIIQHKKEFNDLTWTHNQGVAVSFYGALILTCIDQALSFPHQGEVENIEDKMLKYQVQHYLKGLVIYEEIASFSVRRNLEKPYKWHLELRYPYYKGSSSGELLTVTVTILSLKERFEEEQAEKEAALGIS